LPESWRNEILLGRDTSTSN